MVVVVSRMVVWLVVLVVSQTVTSSLYVTLWDDGMLPGLQPSGFSVRTTSPSNPNSKIYPGRIFNDSCVRTKITKNHFLTNRSLTSVASQELYPEVTTPAHSRGRHDLSMLFTPDNGTTSTATPFRPLPPTQET